MAGLETPSAVGLTSKVIIKMVLGLCPLRFQLPMYVLLALIRVIGKQRLVIFQERGYLIAIAAVPMFDSVDVIDTKQY